jgi:hypothetical protein
LEPRQLLSGFPAGARANVLPSQVVAHPDLQAASLVSRASPSGLSPSQIRQAYGVNAINFSVSGGQVSGTGAGQTIAIVDAYHDPNIAADLGRFDAQYGLPAPPSFTQYTESGLSQANAGWALETALDVEWAHAIAPAANIVLMEADPTNLFSAVNFARQLPGVSVVSMSWGMGEFWGESSFDSLFTTPSGHIGGSGLPGGITFVASSGDSGAWSGTQYPADSPNVLSVGGTSLNAGSQGLDRSETAWGGSGGGYSLLEPAPSYQAGAFNSNAPNAGLRTTPDVAWNADPSQGVSVYNSVAYDRQSGWFTVGGTSAGAPAWAGLIAIADQGLALAGKGSLSNAQASLYQLPSADFNDITTGSNGYPAGRGYDLVTGLGSPRADRVVAGLVAAHGGKGATSSLTGRPALAIGASPHDIIIITSSPTTTSGSGTGSTNGSGSTSSTGSGSGSSSASATGIAPLTPVILTGSSNGRTVVVVIIVVQPLVTHFGPSTEPVTTQTLLSRLSSQLLTTNLTHFGQSVDDELEVPIQAPPIAIQPEGIPLIDIIEPLQPAAPAEGDAPQAGQPAPLRGASLARLVPVLTDRGLDHARDWTGDSLLPDPLVSSASRSKNQTVETRASWGLSTMFGATAVATGGYHLVLRQSDRFQGRWVPGRSKANRSAGRRIGAPVR